MKHPSTLYKKLVRGVLLLAFIAVALILGNRLGDSVVQVFCVFQFLSNRFCQIVSQNFR